MSTLTLYGSVLYGVMYCVVLAWRWPALFPHIALVGIPLVLIARKAEI